MFMYICTCKYIFLCICMAATKKLFEIVSWSCFCQIHVYIHMIYVYMYVYIYVYTYIPIYIRMYTYTHMCMCQCTYTLIYIKTYLCTYIHIHIWNLLVNNFVASSGVKGWHLIRSRAAMIFFLTTSLIAFISPFHVHQYPRYLHVSSRFIAWRVSSLIFNSGADYCSLRLLSLSFTNKHLFFTLICIPQQAVHSCTTPVQRLAAFARLLVCQQRLRHHRWTLCVELIAIFISLVVSFLIHADLQPVTNILILSCNCEHA